MWYRVVDHYFEQFSAQEFLNSGLKTVLIESKTINNFTGWKLQVATKVLHGQFLPSSVGRTLAGRTLAYGMHGYKSAPNKVNYVAVDLDTEKNTSIK